MSKNRFAGPVIAILISIGLIGWMMSGSENDSQTDQTTVVVEKSLIPGVQVVTSLAREVQQSLTVNGITEAARFVTVRSESTGKVVKIFKPQGSFVKSGEIIAQLDLQDIPARIRQAEAFLDQTRLEFEGAQKLNKQGLQTEAQLAAKLANYEQAKSQLASLNLQRANASIRAPFTGQVENARLELGSYVRQGDAVADVYDYSKLIFVGAVSEKDISSITKNQAATVELINGDVANAKISYIGSITNPSTRTFSIELTVDKFNRDVSGVTSEATINLNSALGHYVSPALLIINNAGEMGLKALNEFNQVIFKEVDIIRSDTNGVWISGLPQNENIIIVGQGFVKEGDEAKPTFVDFKSDIAVGL